MKPGFYVTFWQLSLYDIQYPAKNYAEAEEKIKESLISVNDQINQLEKDTRRESYQSLKLAKAQKDELLQQQAKLSAESMRHALHFEKSKSRLNAEKAKWFHYDGPESQIRNGVVVRQNQNRQLLSHCILPRAVHSPIDAIFCARFTMLLHALGTANFSSLTFFDKLFADGILYGTLLTCTSYEAENLGMFFSEIFAELGHWRLDIDVFIHSGLGKRVVDGEVSYMPGLLYKFEEKDITESKLIDHPIFLRAMEKWHRHTATAIVDCLHSEDYMHRRNTITLLRNMIGVFPVITTHGLDIVDALEDIEYTDEREDLKLAARALLVHLKRNIPTWVEVYDFKSVSPEMKDSLIEKAQLLAKEREKKRLLRQGVRARLNQPPEPAISSTKREEEPTSISSGPPRRTGDRNGISSLPASLPRIPTGPRRVDDAHSTRGGISTHSESPRNPPSSRRIPQTSRESASKESDIKTSRANAIEIKPRAGRPTQNDEAGRGPSSLPGNEGKSANRSDRRRMGELGSNTADDRGRGNEEKSRRDTDRRENDRQDASRDNARRELDQRDNSRGDQPRGEARGDPRGDLRGEPRGELRGEARVDRRGERRGDSRAQGRGNGRNASRRGGSDADSGKPKDKAATGSNAVTPVGGQANRLRDSAAASDSREGSPNRGSRGQNGRGEQRRGGRDRDSGRIAKDGGDRRSGEAARDRPAPAGRGSNDNEDHRNTPAKAESGQPNRERENTGRGTRRDGAEEKPAGRSDSSVRSGNAGGRRGGAPDPPSSGGSNNRTQQPADTRSADRKAHMEEAPRRPASNSDDRRKPAREGGDNADNEPHRRGTENPSSWNEDRSSNRPDSGRLESRQRNEKEREKRHREWDRDRGPPMDVDRERGDRFRERDREFRENTAAGGNSRMSGGSGYHLDRKHNRSNGEYEGNAGKRRRTNR